MTFKITMAALIKAWPELAKKAGVEWPSLYWQLLDSVRAYLAVENDDARMHIADQA